MEHFEYMDTILTEYQETLDQEAFEEDMAKKPYGNEWPPEQEPDWPDEGPFDEMGFDPYEGCYTWDC